VPFDGVEKVRVSRQGGTSRGAYPGWWGKSHGCFFFFCFFSLFCVLTAEFASVMYEKEKRDCSAEGRAI